MLARLRLDRFVGGDDEEDEVESGGAGEHVADEAFVAGDVDEAEADDSSSRNAKPRSMVMPRRFSSARRSGCVPVRASTSADLPWSMWPAVPTMMLLGAFSNEADMQRRLFRNFTRMAGCVSEHRGGTIERAGIARIRAISCRGSRGTSATTKI